MPMSFKPLPFFKMGSLGNCYIFIEAKNVEKYSLKKLAKEVSDTSMGIGADGLIIVDTAKPPFKMRILNRDGSTAEMCGNGI
ncbi:MAG: diaminopimelate epimerase, partial [Candidatus Zixiibacteriota bacterium]